MTKIAVSSYDMASLAAARRAGESRKYLWAQIRARFSIPTDVKLGVEPGTYYLYVKDSSPRSYLRMSESNRCVGHSPDAPPAPVVAVQVDPAAIPAAHTNGRFITADQVPNGADSGWVRLTFAQVAGMVDASDFDDVVLPDGFPVDTDSDLVVDTQTASVYVRN